MRHYALLGHNISYSLSPRIHAAIYRYLGVEADYKLISLSEAELAAKIDSLRRLDGFNVTKPHKVRILPYLAADYSGCGSVNTVRCEGGALYGYNTDGKGFARHLSSLCDPAGLDTLVLGAGGAARVIVRELTAAGARVRIYNRTPERAASLAAETGTEVFAAGAPQLIVNCASFGFSRGENPLPPTASLAKIRFAYDTIYAPPETDFLSACRQAGAKAANGLGMLVWQAIFADEILCGTKIEDKENLFRTIINDLEEK